LYLLLLSAGIVGSRSIWVSGYLISLLFFLFKLVTWKLFLWWFILSICIFGLLNWPNLVFVRWIWHCSSCCKVRTTLWLKPKLYLYATSFYGLFLSNTCSQTWYCSLHSAYDRAAIKFRGVDADINFSLRDYEEDLKQVLNNKHARPSVLFDFSVTI